MPIEGYNLSATLKTGFIPFDLNNARIIGVSSAGDTWVNSTASGFAPGGALSTLSAPKLTAISTAVRATVIDWTSASLVPVQFPTVTLPPDFTSLSAPVFNILAGRSSAATAETGTPSWSANFWANQGSSQAVVSIPVTNLTSSAATQYSAALSTVQIGNGYPGTIVCTIFPLSTADENKLYAAWITYTRAQRG